MKIKIIKTWNKIDEIVLFEEDILNTLEWIKIQMLDYQISLFFFFYIWQYILYNVSRIFCLRSVWVFVCVEYEWFENSVFSSIRSIRNLSGYV